MYHVIVCCKRPIVLVKLIQAREISSECIKVGVALTPIGEECERERLFKPKTTRKFKRASGKFLLKDKF